ncbi:XdhC family protein [Pelosinus baikalensis]|uniref:XdhC family protein n=1 Tax=Pelosinus baikalensis TaxID=2892015 RepID=A0ABS8HM83_9FIRM|nr:XdhC family protein [Pelosinus baikalensis]MCC5464285.1 XdhC family protein [Pelosinus baikalensis]
MIFSSLLSAQNSGRTVDCFTVIASSLDSDIGKMLIIHQDGRVESQLEGMIGQHVLDTVKNLPWSKAMTLYLEDQSGEKYRIFWDRMTTKYHAIVFGGGHISQPLVQMLIQLDFIVTIVDDRPEFANQARFPGAHTIICENFHQAFKKLVISSDTAVIIVTRGHRYDLECLRATMDSKARYLGMIGSKKRVKEVFAVLREEGRAEGLEGRLKAPIGLDIRAETPVEIAVSIVAEVIGVFRGGSSGRSLSGCREGDHGLRNP